MRARPVAFTSAARKQFRHLHPQIKARLEDALAHFARTGEGDVVPMQGRTGYRLKVGGYRAVLDVSEDAVTVLEVGPRGDIY